MRENTIFLPIAVLLILFTSSFGLVVVASAQTRTVGVSVGNKFRYSNTVNWSSNNPNATPPFDVVTSNKTEWFELTVMDISGTNISCQQLTHLKNGTEITVNNWVDIDVDKLAVSIASLANKRYREILENEKQQSLTSKQEKKHSITGLVKSVVRKARELSEKLENFE